MPVRRRPLPLVIVAALSAPALALAGCAGAESGSGTAGDDGIVIVTSTDVYADIVQAVGGDLVTVEPIISGTAADPHSYEATARDQLAVADADLVVFNGGGYDAFMGTLVEASGTAAPVVSVVEVSGLLLGEEDDHDHDEEHDDEEHADEDADAATTDEEGDHDDHDHVEGFNEHVWYSLHAMEAFAHELEHELAELDPANASVYEDNAHEFAEALESLEDRAGEIAATTAGLSVLVTEPTPLYLLEELGFVNVTPAEFTEAIEEGSEISVSVFDEMITLASGGTVALLAYNEQTTGPETERVLESAESAGLPVVSFLETLPDGQDYLSWMTNNLEAVAAAVP